MKIEIILNYFWSVDVWDPGSLFIQTHTDTHRERMERNQNIRSCYLCIGGIIGH